MSLKRFGLLKNKTLAIIYQALLSVSFPQNLEKNKNLPVAGGPMFASLGHILYFVP
jgi:hypothetical protein